MLDEKKPNQPNEVELNAPTTGTQPHPLTTTHCTSVESGQAVNAEVHLSLSTGMQAVVFKEPRMIIFSADPIPDHLRAELSSEMGGEIREGLELEMPDDVNEWPHGKDRPEDVLAVANDDPKHFRVFKYRRDIDARYQPVEMTYADVPSWNRFLEAFRPLDRISRMTDASDRPGLDEEIVRNLTESAY